MEELQILRKMNIGDESQIAKEFEDMHSKMERLRRENETLSSRIQHYAQEERMIQQNVDLKDRMALKKLVVMLKLKNDKLERKLGKSFGSRGCGFVFSSNRKEYQGRQ